MATPHASPRLDEPPDAESSRKSSGGPPAVRRDLRAAWAIAIAIALGVFVALFLRLEPAAPTTLRLATGGPSGAYAAFGRAYRDVLATHDVDLELVETSGSIENLRLLTDGQVDLALVQGGTAREDAEGDLEALASLFLEPVWLFHRPALPLDSLADLAGARVAIGPEGSGTRPLALRLLADNGLAPREPGFEPDPESSPEPESESDTTFLGIPISGDDAVRALREGSIDAAFLVAAPSAPSVRALLADPSVSLYAFSRRQAYHVRHRFLSGVTLGRGQIDLRADLPSADVPLVAAAASMVARRDLHHALVPLLVDTTQEIHGAGGPFTEPGTFPSSRYLDLPQNTEAEHYLRKGPSFLFRVLPYRTAVSVDRLKILLLPFIPLLLVLGKAAPPLYRWRIRSKIYRWYDDLRQLDQFVLSRPTPEAARARLGQVERLENEVTEVSVPLSYMDEFYNLRMHIELIESKLRETIRSADDEPPRPG